MRHGSDTYLDSHENWHSDIILSRLSMHAMYEMRDVVCAEKATETLVY